MRGLGAATAAFLLLFTASAEAKTDSRTGGAQYQAESAGSRSARAERLPHGRASIPPSAPPEVQELVRRGNNLVGKPYVWGGGHDPDFGVGGPGYDCSGSVSYVLRKLLEQPLASGGLSEWGMPGKGQWVTIYANGGHAYMVVAGLRLDTSAAGDPSGLDGPRWRPNLRSNEGFVARHPGTL